MKILLFYCLFYICIFADSCEKIEAGKYTSDSICNMQMLFEDEIYAIML